VLDADVQADVLHDASMVVKLDRWCLACHARPRRALGEHSSRHVPPCRRMRTVTHPGRVHQPCAIIVVYMARLTPALLRRRTW